MPQISEVKQGIDGKLYVEYSDGTTSVKDLTLTQADTYKRTTLSFAGDSTCLTTGAVSSGTWMHSLTVPFAFDSVRVGFVSVDTVNSASGLKISVASSETALNNGTQWPIISGSRNDTVWRNATFNGAGTGTPAVATSTANPSITWTDWTPCKSLPRTDGFGNYILLCRAYLPSAWAVLPGYSAVWSTKTSSIASNSGEIYEVRQVGADYIATPSGWSNTSTAGASPGLIFQFRVRQPNHSLAFYGDSTFQGFAGTATYSWADMACRVLGVMHKNAGWSGQTTAQTLTRLKADISRGEKPTCIMFESASPNDASQSYTTTTLYQNRAYVLDVLDQAQQIGAAVILTTPMPYMGTNPDANNQAAYLEHYSWVKSLETSDGRVQILDFSSLHDTTYPGKWKSAYSADGLHPNDTAKSIMNTLAQTAIRNTLHV